jgi:hypothetical protein
MCRKKKGESEANWNVNSRNPPKKSTMKKKLIYNNENNEHNNYNKKNIKDTT